MSAVETGKADIARWQRELANFNAAEDPGQPTAADVEACHALRLAEENARREKEHEEELQRREKALNEQNNGRRFIEQTAAEHPIEEGQPVVRIHWSEHPAFYGWKDDELVLSVAAAEIILKTFDEQKRAENGGYYKTKFSIEEDGEVVYGGGRYDLSYFSQAVTQTYVDQAVHAALVNLEARPAPAGANTNIGKP